VPVRSGASVRLLPDGRHTLAFIKLPGDKPERWAPEWHDLDTDQALRRFPEAESTYRAAISGDGERLAILGRGLDVYAIGSGERVAHLDDAEGAFELALSHDGRRAAVWGLHTVEMLSGGTGQRSGPPPPPPFLSVWDLDRGARLWRDDRLGGQHWFFTRDGRFLMGPPTRIVPEIVRVADGQPLRYGEDILGIAPDGRRALVSDRAGLSLVSPDGSASPPALSRPPRVLLRSADGRAEAVLAPDGSLQLQREGMCTRLDPRFDRDAPIAFSPDGAYFYAIKGNGSSAPAAHVYRTDTGARVRSFGARGAAAQVLPGAGQVIFDGEDGHVRRFQALSGVELPGAEAPRLTYSAPIGGAVHDIRDPDGERASRLSSGYVVSTRDGRYVGTPTYVGEQAVLSMWDLAEPARVLDLAVRDFIDTMALSPYEHFLAAGLLGGRLVLWRRPHYRAVPIDGRHNKRVRALAFDSTDAYLASAGEDGLVLLVNTGTGQVVGKARLPFDWGKGLWFSPDGRELRVETARGLRVSLGIAR
jgi:WD40 repeat protein